MQSQSTFFSFDEMPYFHFRQGFKSFPHSSIHKNKTPMFSHKYKEPNYIKHAQRSVVLIWGRHPKHTNTKTNRTWPSLKQLPRSPLYTKGPGETRYQVVRTESRILETAPEQAMQALRSDSATARLKPAELKQVFKWARDCYWRQSRFWDKLACCQWATRESVV